MLCKWLYPHRHTLGVGLSMLYFVVATVTPFYSAPSEKSPIGNDKFINDLMLLVCRFFFHFVMCIKSGESDGQCEVCHPALDFNQLEYFI